MNSYQCEYYVGGRKFVVTFQARDWLSARAEADKLLTHPQRHNEEFMRACELYSQTDPKLFAQVLGGLKTH